ncbi:MAG: hypothetical protein ABI875_00155 [Gemmatimonadales bacterium]
MKENLTRYAYWQFRDFIRERSIALLLVGLLLGFMMIAPMRAMMGPNMSGADAKRLVLLVLPQIVFIETFIVFNGIISTDRKMGYYRFLFSKPVGIPAFYAQHFAVYLAGFLAVFAILLGVLSVAVAPFNPLWTLAYCALVYLSLGGIAFFISSLFRYDWPVLAGVYLSSLIANAVWADKTGWRMVIRDLLPPTHKLNQAMNDLISLGTVDAKSVAWLLGYSALFFIAGLVVLWRRPIG